MEVQREHWTTHQLIVHGSKFFLQICFLGFCISKGRETASFGSLKSAILEREERKQKHQSHIRGLNAFDRHNKSLNEYGNYQL
ncbi:hypothetical protein OIU79_013955 [Salix purpurea]|uniref:Uncharacterized protein n=1 Tax=Salix purpurea TaxID=77065 RepID=A0A9Q0PQF7_SALPP|nr:hypothetical protein OIU79_013955 [Salix purpurea]